MSFRNWATRVASLAEALREIEPEARRMGFSQLEQQPWHGALYHKLVPQLEQEPYLIVAVTGGTNTGKSVIFNHLVGHRTSRAHPDATQTKHPVCTVPHGFLTSHDLARVFPEFEIREWCSDEDPLAAGPDNLLFVREDRTGTQPGRLLLMDTPDVDGVLAVNWRRAELVRHAADVLVCVLTQQKYNDAAIRDFFRQAAQADKVVLVVFNMLNWPAQRDLCQGWLNRFTAETGVKAQQVYALPFDHDAAESNRLPVYSLSPGSTDLRADLAELQFDEIKIRTLHGSLRQVLDNRQGVPAYLDSLAVRSHEFAEAAAILGKDLRLQIADLPQLPRQLVWDEIWKWLETRRTRFDKAVSAVYGTVGSLVTRWFRRSGGDPAEEFTHREWERMQAALVDVLARLDLLRRGGNEILREVLDDALQGLERARLFDDLKARHAAMPLVSDGFRQFIRGELDAFEQQNPRLVQGITWALVSTAAVRPVITIALFLGGAAGLDLAAGHMAVSVAGDIVAGAAVAVTGEGLFAGARLPLQTLLTRLFTRFYVERAELLAKALHDRVLGPSVEKLTSLAGVAQSPAFLRIRELTRELKTAGEG